MGETFTRHTSRSRTTHNAARQSPRRQSPRRKSRVSVRLPIILFFVCTSVLPAQHPNAFTYRTDIQGTAGRLSDRFWTAGITATHSSVDLPHADHYVAQASRGTLAQSRFMAGLYRALPWGFTARPDPAYVAMADVSMLVGARNALGAKVTYELQDEESEYRSSTFDCVNVVATWDHYARQELRIRWGVGFGYWHTRYELKDYPGRPTIILRNPIEEEWSFVLENEVDMVLSWGGYRHRAMLEVGGEIGQIHYEAAFETVINERHTIGPIVHWSLFGGQGGALSEIGLGAAWRWYIIPQCYIQFAPRYLGSLWDSDYSEFEYTGVVGVRL